MKKKMMILTLLLVLTSLAFGAYKYSRLGYESAPYTVVSKEGDFEIRNYPELVVVSTAVEPTNAENNKSFMRLFDYISGKNEASQKIAMTTPVIMDQEGASRRMSFVLPQEVAARGAPPATSEQVKIETIPGGRFAVYRFSGSWEPEQFASQKKKLMEWIKRKGLQPVGEPLIAGYDPPFTPAALRRNEVLLRAR